VRERPTDKQRAIEIKTQRERERERQKEKKSSPAVRLFAIVDLQTLAMAAHAELARWVRAYTQASAPWGSADLRRRRITVTTARSSPTVDDRNDYRRARAGDAWSFCIFGQPMLRLFETFRNFSKLFETFRNFLNHF